MNNRVAVLEYIWLDGYAENTDGVANLRSKAKIVPENKIGLGPDSKRDDVPDVEDLPNWSFDGSSTMQAEGNFSDCVLKPVFVCRDPFNFAGSGSNFLVMCEVLNADGTPHVSNKRASLMKTWEKYKQHKMWFGLEQEYTLYNRDGTWPLNWPEKGFPNPQGRYYCGVGADVSFGRDTVMDHLTQCLEVGLPISGINAEVMPSQWEFQIGPMEAPAIADAMWIARYILNRCGELNGTTVKLDPKPFVIGDWNGTGCHVNFSTEEMRNSLTEAEIKKITDALEAKREEHIKVYGKDNDKRLTGKHETCSIHQFRCGVSDRGASIRIPHGTAVDGKGYLEDRRPAANIDPYEVCEILMRTVCDTYKA